MGPLAPQATEPCPLSRPTPPRVQPYARHSSGGTTPRPAVHETTVSRLRFSAQPHELPPRAPSRSSAAVGNASHRTGHIRRVHVAHAAQSFAPPRPAPSVIPQSHPRRSRSLLRAPHRDRKSTRL